MFYNTVLLCFWQLYTIELVACYNVVVDTEVGERIWTLEHHAYLEAYENGVHFKYVLIVEHDVALCSSTGYELMHTVDAPQESGLTTAGRAHYRYNIVAWHLHVHIFYNVIISKPGVVIDRLYNCTFHFLVMIFVKMFNVNTQISNMQDAPHTRSCQSL